MKHVALIFTGFQTHSDRGGFGTKTVQGGLEIFRRHGGAVGA